MAAEVVIVEDHGLLAATLATALELRGVSIDTVAPGDDLTDLRAALLERGPQLVLLDLDLGACGEATPLIAPLTDAGIAVVMVTGVADATARARCVAAGAVGILGKAEGVESVVEAIDRVRAQGTLLSEHERQEQLAWLREREQEQQRLLAPFAALTGREAGVLSELMAGHTVEEIAAAAHVSRATVRTQVRSILSKLGVHSQVAAIGLAHEVGWQPPQWGQPND